MPKVKTKFGQENKLIHPNSRKADQMSREWHRDVRVKNKKKEAANKMTALCEKIKWFRDNLETGETYTPEMTAMLIEKYLGRFNAELEEITSKNQVGQRNSRQHASRQDAIELTNKLERDEYEGCGFEIPDLLCPKNLEYIQSWNGELRYIQNIALKRYRQRDLENSSNKEDRVMTEEKMDLVVTQ